MEICTIETLKLLETITALNEIKNEITLRFKEDGLKITEIDDANVCLCDIFINKELFVEYNESFKENPIDISINTTDILKLLKTNKNSYLCPVGLSVDDNTETRNNLKLSFSNGLNSVFPLIDLTNINEVKIPNLNPAIRIITGSKEFKQAITSLNSIFESIQFIAKDNKFKLSAKSDLNNSEMPLKVLDNFGDGISKYHSEYLKKIVKILINDSLTLKYGFDYPLQILQENKGFRILFILAPRIDNE